MMLIPILVFTNFTNETSSDTNTNLYPASLLYEELKKLVQMGYTSLSIEQINTETKRERLSGKYFCLAFVGGYLGNYSFAYPILNELGIHADLFVPGDLVGYKEYPGITNFIPHYSWEQIREMKKSGFIDVYPMWHPFDAEEKLDTIIVEKIKQISDNVPGSIPNKSFWININVREAEKINALKKAGVESYLIPVLNTSIERLEIGALPYIEVSPDKGVLAAIDYFCEASQKLIRREKSIKATETLLVKNDYSQYNSVKLPIESHPLVRNYLRHAIPLSVLGAERKDVAELCVLNEYIDIVFRPWYHWYDYDNQLYDSWDSLICNTLYRDFIEAAKLDVVESIIGGLNTGYYADVWLDSYYVPGKSAYNNMHLAHNILVYGYDKDSNMFDALSYTINGKYEHLCVAPESIVKGCSNEYFLRIIFLKRNKETSIVYNRDHILKKLRHYIYSEYDCCSYSKYTSYDNNQLVNYEASLSFPDYLLNTAERENRIYLVALFGFLEHKKCMAWRLCYIAKRERLPVIFFENYENYACKTAENLLALGMKFQTTQNQNILPRIYNAIIEFNKREKEEIFRLISSIGETSKE